MMKVAIATHIHENGSDGYIFAYNSESIPDEQTVADVLEINWESDKGEMLELAPLVNLKTGNLKIVGGKVDEMTSVDSFIVRT